MSGEPLLRLRSFGVAFGAQAVLTDVTFDLPRRGLTILVGPAGSGKSTLLRTLAGLNDAHPSLATWGTATLDGRPIQERTALDAASGEVRRGVGLVMQHARFFLDSVRENLVSALPNRAALDPATQTRIVRSLLEVNGLRELVLRLDDDVASLSTPLQRRLAIVRALVSEPLLLLADEPTAGLEDHDALEVLTLLRVHAGFRSILFVTHNQRFARAAGGRTALLAGGSIQELAPTATFFSSPRTTHGHSFVRTGGCVAASAEPQAEVAVTRSRFEGPRGFFWVLPGRLGGLPRPGIVAAVEDDLAGLQRLGVSTLVTLEESPTVGPELLERFQIASIHFPVVDMGVPELEATRALCGEIETLLQRRQVVALHCRAGLGRTGTLLACQLIFTGEPALAALDRMRRLNPRCIESQPQIRFLSLFEQFMETSTQSHGNANT